jgi:hypothetical protein
MMASLMLGACSLLTDVGSLQSDAGVIPEAGAPDVPIADATSEQAPPDAADAEAGTLGFCAALPTKPKFCEDFDEGLFSAQFSNVQQNNGTCAASSAASRSAPSSFLAQVPASDAGAGSAFMSRLFVGGASRVDYAFDFRAEAWPTAGKSVVVAGIIIDEGLPSQHTLSFYVTDSYAAVEEIFLQNNMNKYVDHALITHPLLNQWTRVAIALDLQARTAAVTLDGATALGSTALDASWGTGVPSIDLGISYVATTAMGSTMRYDNVVCDFK